MKARLVRGVLLGALAAGVLPAAAADYFVSASLGSDDNRGHVGTPGNGDGPLATLAAAGALALRSGDRLLLRCGERFGGSLQITLQGGADVAIGSYGPCAGGNAPVLDGRVPLERPADGSVQRLSAPRPVVQVFAADQPLPAARFPEAGYLLVPPATPVSGASLPALPVLAQRVLAGAQLRARSQEWLIEERAVVDDSGRLRSPLTYPLRPGAGFYLQGKGWMIGAAPAWAFDAAEGALYVRAPAGAALAMVPAGPLLSVKGKGAVRIAGLVLQAAGGNAIDLHVDGAVDVRDTTVRRAADNGIAVAGAPLATLENNTIDGTGLDGIFFAEVRRAVVRGNRVAGAGLLSGPRASLAAINAHRTDAALIEGNVVDGSAYHGIRFSGAAQVLRNYVARTCRLLSDCAGLYTWRRNADDRRPHSEVQDNVVVDVQGDTSVKLGVNDWFTGIYLDDYTNDVTVAGNVVVGANQGIYVHNAYGVVVRDNVVRALQKTVIDASDPKKVPRVVDTPNRVAGNSERVGAFAATFRNRAGALRDFVPDGQTEIVISPQGAASRGARQACATPAADAGRKAGAAAAVLDCD